MVVDEPISISPDRAATRRKHAPWSTRAGHRVRRGLRRVAAVQRRRARAGRGAACAAETQSYGVDNGGGGRDTPRACCMRALGRGRAGRRGWHAFLRAGELYSRPCQSNSRRRGLELHTVLDSNVLRPSVLFRDVLVAGRRSEVGSGFVPWERHGGRSMRAACSHIGRTRRQSPSKVLAEFQRGALRCTGGAANHEGEISRMSLMRRKAPV